MFHHGFLESGRRQTLLTPELSPGGRSCWTFAILSPENARQRHELSSKRLSHPPPPFSLLFKRQYMDGKRPRLGYSQPRLGLAEPSSRWQVESLSLWSDVEITCRGQVSGSVFREQPQFLQASCSLLSREPGVTWPWRESKRGADLCLERIVASFVAWWFSC